MSVRARFGFFFCSGGVWGPRLSGLGRIAVALVVPCTFPAVGVAYLGSARVDSIHDSNPRVQ